MLYHLTPRLVEIISAFNVFRYITFRTAYATVTALIITLIAGPMVIRALRGLRIKDSVERDSCDDLSDLHIKKEGTPTMGGILIVGSVVLATLLWGNFSNRYIPFVLLTFVLLAMVGMVDDYLKLRRGSSKGLSTGQKLVAQSIIGLAFGLFLYCNPIETARVWMGEEVHAGAGTVITLPFFKNMVLDLGILYVPFVFLVIVGSSNAVNLTDGLDGLAAGCIIACAIAYAGMTYLAGHWNFSSYLNILYVKDSGELVVILGALIGACIGFLWYNAHPAEVFMGDTGSLPLGGLIGAVAVVIKQEILLVVVGGIFVAEALSVIIQVISYKTTGKRVFRMAPLHHHFELGGWPESKVTIRFWIIAGILALISVSTLKLR